MAALSLSIAALALSACGDSGPPGATGAIGATGATGATGPAGAEVNWVDVTGSSVQAVANTGYMADSSSQVTITLPSSPRVGDIVEVSGPGDGGWKIAQNAGQQISVGFENAQWRPTGPSQSWKALVASTDGSVLAAAASGGPIYMSRDDGQSWTAQSSGNALWSSLAMSTDGIHLLAASNSGNQLYVSADSGQTWSTQGPSIGWEDVAVSPDGTDMIASGYNSTNQWGTYASVNGGASWSQIAAYAFYSFAWPTQNELIGTGSDLVSNMGIFVSSDAGVSWSLVEAEPGSYATWEQVKASSDGTQVYALGAGTGLGISRSSGASNSWTVNQSSPWTNLSVSADGTALIATGSLPAAISTDSGQNWTPVDPDGEQFSSFVVTDDDQKVIAGTNGGPLYALSSVTTVGTAGAVTGKQNQAVTLQYVGNGVFVVINNEGPLAVQ